MDRKLPIPQKYAYLAALLLTLIMVLQSTDTVEGQLQINLYQVILFACNYLTWALGLTLVYRLTAGFDLSLGRWRTALIRLTLTALGIAAVQLVLSNFLYYLILVVFVDFPANNILNNFSEVWLRAFASRLVDFIVIFGVLRALDNHRKLNEQKLAVAELEGVLTQTRLEALKMQLNPHFLFNALHAIHSMIGYDNEKARSMLLKISSLLRKILELGEKQLISLSDELNYLKDYLDIEQERFHDRLSVSYSVDDSLLTAEVPSLILQPLAENALKHGISPLEGPGIIRLVMATHGNTALSLSLTNTVSDEQTQVPHSMGIGLSNLEKRLDNLFGDTYELKINSTTSEFSIEIIIPLRHEH